MFGRSVAGAALVLMLAGGPAWATQTPEQNLNAVRGPIAEATGREVVPLMIERYCHEDGRACSALVGDIQIATYGRGVVVLHFYPGEDHGIYRLACAGAFAGLSGAHPATAAEVLTVAFNTASVAGSFKQEVAGVQVQVQPGSGGFLGCRFFKY